MTHATEILASVVCVKKLDSSSKTAIVGLGNFVALVIWNLLRGP